jgi:hypothetical protein
VARRITCKTPSTGKVFNVYLANVTSTGYTSISEAPDFSVPDPAGNYTERDPGDIARAIRPGEVFFITPLAAKNKTATTRWIDVRLTTEDGTVISFGKVTVPGYDTAFIPIQGRSLFKRDPIGPIGDKLEVSAEVNNVFDVWSTAEEKLSSEHIGVE